MAHHSSTVFTSKKEQKTRFSGAFFIEKNKRTKDHRIRNLVFLMSSLIVYFMTKTLLLTNKISSQFQIVNQISLFICVVSFFVMFSSLNDQLELLFPKIKRVIAAIASITLELYLVQAYIIFQINKTEIFFPVNWLVVTTLVFFIAFVLHWGCERINKLCERIIVVRSNKLTDN